MDEKKIDELVNKALREDLSLPEGLSERLERQIDRWAVEEQEGSKDLPISKPLLLRKRSLYAFSGIAAAVLAAVLLLFNETERTAPELADTFSDPKEAAIVAQNALAFMSTNLNKGLGQMNEAQQEIAKINKVVNKHLNDIENEN